MYRQPCAEKSFRKLSILPNIFFQIYPKVGSDEPDIVYDFFLNFGYLKYFEEKILANLPIIIRSFSDFAWKE